MLATSAKLGPRSKCWEACHRSCENNLLSFVRKLRLRANLGDCEKDDKWRREPQWQTRLWLDGFLLLLVGVDWSLMLCLKLQYTLVTYFIIEQNLGHKDWQFPKIGEKINLGSQGILRKVHLQMNEEYVRCCLKIIFDFKKLSFF